MPGWFFVTICTKQKAPVLGEISNSEPRLNPLGEIAKKFWDEIPNHFHNAEVDEYTIMPNHIHGIVIIQTNPLSNKTTDFKKNSRQLPKPKSLSTIIRSYKSAVTRWARSNGFPSFAWQPRFYDHIIRDDEDLHRIRRYISENPSKWELDEYFKPITPRSFT
jgi:REP element-mobilizing transposase RayT